MRAEQWRQLRSEIIEPSAAPVISLVAEETGTIERRGTSWVLGVAGRKIVVPDLLGMNYLARLLTNPGVEFAAAALVAESGTALAGVAAPRDQPVLDDRALAATDVYRVRRPGLPRWSFPRRHRLAAGGSSAASAACLRRSA